MKKIIAFVLSAVTALSMAGCSSADLASGKIELQDGTYRAEFSDYDEFGWKDFVEVTVSEGQLYEVVYDAENEDGTKLKSRDEGYKTEMESFNGTYPAKYDKDLINQFLQSGSADSVDTVAGATISTNNFKTLVVAAMRNAVDGDTDVAVVGDVTADATK